MSAVLGVIFFAFATRTAIACYVEVNNIETACPYYSLTVTNWRGQFVNASNCGLKMKKIYFSVPPIVAYPEADRVRSLIVCSFFFFFSWAMLSASQLNMGLQYAPLIKCECLSFLSGGFIKTSGAWYWLKIWRWVCCLGSERWYRFLGSRTKERIWAQFMKLVFENFRSGIFYHIAYIFSEHLVFFLKWFFLLA